MRTAEDPGDNYLLKKLKIDTCVLIIGAVYGPNHNDGMFYANLEQDITALRDHAGVPVVLGGRLELHLEWKRI
jgi:hypothetical protein